MKNIFITALYRLIRDSSRKSISSDYEEIHKLCVDSFLKNLSGIDRHIVLSGNKNTSHDMFKEIFYRIKDIYHSEPCNIIFTDADTLCVKPVNIFNKYNTFSMFLISITGKFSTYKKVPKRLWKSLKPWFMSNVRYYPHGLNDTVWRTGTELANKWINVWAYECIIYNSMIHSQFDGMSYTEIKKTYHKPEFNYFYATDHFDMDIPLEEARIIHFAGSRGSKEVLNKMRNWK
jgi:hypothetical protein